MPTYERFEDLPVWQAAASLYDRVDDFLAHAPPQLRPSFRDQLERATLSVSNNIAEGFERGTTNELLMFLYIARGSAGEVRSMLTLLARRAAFSDLKSRISDLKSLAESLLAPAARVGRLPAKLRDRRPAPPQRKEARRAPERRRRIPGHARSQPPRRSPAPGAEVLTRLPHLKSQFSISHLRSQISTSTTF